MAVSALSRRYKLSCDALYRHAKAHLPPQLRAQLIAGPDLSIDLDQLRETESQSLLANLIALRQRLLAALDVSEEYRDGGMLTRVTSQLHENLRITGTLLGDLGVGSSSTNITNILISPEYIAFRGELLKALQPFSDARIAVAEVLHTIEHQAADKIDADPLPIKHKPDE